MSHYSRVRQKTRLFNIISPLPGSLTSHRAYSPTILSVIRGPTSFSPVLFSVVHARQPRFSFPAPPTYSKRRRSNNQHEFISDIKKLDENPGFPCTMYIACITSIGLRCIRFAISRAMKQEAGLFLNVSGIIADSERRVANFQARSIVVNAKRFTPLFTLVLLVSTNAFSSMIISFLYAHLGSLSSRIPSE